MTHTLRATLAARQDLHQLRQLLSVHQITMVIVDDPIQQERLAAASMQVISLQAIPRATFPTESDQTSRQEWLTMQWQQTGFYEAGYLKLTQYGQAPWIQITFPTQPDWLAHLWESLTVPDVLIVNQPLTSICAIFGEEHVLEYHVHVLDSSPAV